MLGLGIGSALPYVVYVSSVFVAIYSIIKKSALGLVFIVALLPVYTILRQAQLSELPLANNITDMTILAVIIGAIIQSDDQDFDMTERAPLVAPIILLISYTFLSFLLGTTLFDGFTSEINLQRLAHWKNYMMLPVLYLVSYKAFREKKWQHILFVSLFVSFIASDLRFRQVFSNFAHTHYENINRVSGTLGNLGPNEMGAFHTIYVLFVAGLFMIDKNVKRRIAYAIFIAGGMYSVIYSFSRGAYIGIVIGYIFISLIRDKRLLIPLVAFLLVWKLILPVSVVERIDGTIVEEGSRDDVVSVGGVNLETANRTEIWKIALEYFAENPITGKGYNNFNYLMGRDTHNLYLKIMAEQGIIGLMIILWLYLLALRSGWRLYSSAEEEMQKALGFGFLCAVIGSIVTNFFGDRWTYIQIGGIYWVLWAIVDQYNVRLKVHAKQTSHMLVKGETAPFFPPEADPG